MAWYPTEYDFPPKIYKSLLNYGASFDTDQTHVKQPVTSTPDGHLPQQGHHAPSDVGSISGSILAQKRTLAETAKAKAEFAKKEADILKRRAAIQEQEQLAQFIRQRKELEAENHLLELEKEAAIAQAELFAIEIDRQADGAKSVTSVPVENKLDQTKQYVLHHSHEAIPNSKIPNRSQLGHTRSQDQALDLSSQGSIQDICHGKTPIYKAKFNPNAPEFRPQAQWPAYQLPTDNGPTSEFTRFLLKKELMLSRLINFTDRPESYAAWKSCFLESMGDLRVTPQEEMDLLIKWLGPDSSKQAQCLRTANIHNPNRGLHRIWERLDARYGSPEMVEASLKAKLDNFLKISNKEHSRLYELSDILSEIESIKEDDKYKSLLAYFDSSSGVIPIVRKLPFGIQEKWTSNAVDFKNRFNVAFPPFWFFAQFIRDICRIKNDPSFYHDQPTDASKSQPKSANTRTSVSTRKTDILQLPEVEAKSQDSKCPLHKTNHHLNDCKVFRSKLYQERKDLLKQWGICFKCCSSSDHLARACKQTMRCKECGSQRHPTALHCNSTDIPPSQKYGGETGSGNQQDTSNFSTKCTQICGDGFKGKSCAKTILVKISSKDHPERTFITYAMLDDQSNTSLAKSKLFDLLGVEGQTFPYSLSSCSGTVNSSGRRTQDCIVQSLDGETSFRIPSLIECNNIPNIREEIPTPEVARAYPHLRDIVHLVPPLNHSADILLLIGRNLPEAHHISDQRTGARHTPFAQKLALGWVIVGESCLGRVHQPSKISVNKTHVLHNGRQSIFLPCPNNFNIKENLHLGDPVDFNTNVFERRPDDNKPGLSADDREFLAVMDKHMYRNSDGNWVAPLPFRSSRPRLPNNRPEAIKRAKSLHRSLEKSPVKREHFITFMQNIFERGHAEPAPDLQTGDECWYLPLFGVYHPQKPHQIRGVFDSASQYDGVSLNNVLLSGPDMTNSLLGILLRFRKESIAITGDIQQMFHCFFVCPEHRNFLRFFWYRDNDPSKEMIEFRMCIHVFGNTSSPAVATYGLRRTAQIGEQSFGTDMRNFVDRDFYVDDGITSVPTREQAIDLMTKTQKALKQEGNLRLHKIASNDVAVMNAFPAGDLVKELKDLDLGSDTLPTQRSLGLIWDLQSDTFTFKVSPQEKPFTRRGIFSTVNSLYDPLGFVAPIVIQGKLLLRDLISNTKDWDEPLPSHRRNDWIVWRDSLGELENLHVDRMYVKTSLKEALSKEVHVFSDASEQAIASVAYLKTTDEDHNVDTGFIMGKSKIAPSHGHTVPRLELCAAVLSVELAEIVVEQLDIQPETITFHTDSKIVLGYICNTSRRFYKYVSNRVERITRFSKPSQWKYVSTEDNPADVATRPLQTTQIERSMWCKGPPSLHKSNDNLEVTYPLQSPERDSEIRPDIQVLKISTANLLGSHRFERFSVWTKLIKSIAHLKHISRSYHHNNTCKGWHIGKDSRSVQLYTEAELHVIREVLSEIFGEEITQIQQGKPISKASSLSKLNPILDKCGTLRVGGRIVKASFTSGEKNPIIIPGRHHIATVLVRHYHDKVRHQGRHITEGALRSAGFWIIGGKRLISRIIHSCVKCRKLRGKLQYQKMADLPADRLTPAPAFTYVGVDVFGPWAIVSRKTRGGQANAKRWVVIFTCLCTRAIHLEVIEEMTSSSFINSMRRFVAIRGKVAQFRSDRGTNFVGAANELKLYTVNVEDGPVRDYLYNNEIVWIFNPPHSSHMGGSWERLIRTTRQIMNSIMMDIPSKHLTHEVLTTFIAEVSSIVNARPLVPVSTDPECPEVLSPATLLTHKVDNVTAPHVDLDTVDLYRSQWKCVQILADKFWNRWRRDYLQTLQCRKKWTDEKPSLNKGDVILLKDKSMPRNEWGIGVITKPLPADDGRVRKAEVKVSRAGTTVVYTRPITEMVLLLSSK